MFNPGTDADNWADAPAVSSASDKWDPVLRRLDSLIRRAGHALCSFYDEREGGFTRESETPAGQDSVGATSTARATLALLELERFLAEIGRANEDAGLSEKCRSALEGCARRRVPAFLEADEAERGLVSSNGKNLFTDVQMSIAAMSLADSGRSADDGINDDVLLSAHTLASTAYEQLRETQWKGRAYPDERWGHDFITLHIVRAAELAGAGNDVYASKIAARAVTEISEQLGWFAADSSTRFDPGDLAHALAVLVWCDRRAAELLMNRCIAVLAESQSKDGAWPTTRVIAQAGGKLLHVASYEIGLALALTLERRLASNRYDSCGSLLEVAMRVVQLVDRTFVTTVEDTSYFGWGNDRTRYGNEVESWATSVVLMMLIRLRECVARIQEREVLTRLDVLYKSGVGVGRNPERYGFAPGVDESAEAKAKDALTWVSDPTKSGALKEQLFEKFVLPVLQSPIGRPSASAASFLLPGPPGTRKTSLVESLGKALEWPLVTLTPANFLRHGIDGVEHNAEILFRDLMRLRRAVVLFDECEDLFRLRPKGDDNNNAASRTAGAFITAGMLPRLQALRNQHWVIFALAFNGTLSDIDPAVIRPGRFDFKITMEHPCEEACERYLEDQLHDQGDQKIDVGMRVLKGLRRAQQPKAITWPQLDAIVRFLNAHVAGSEDDGDAVVERGLAVVQSISGDGPPDLS